MEQPVLVRVPNSRPRRTPAAIQLFQNGSLTVVKGFAYNEAVKGQNFDVKDIRVLRDWPGRRGEQKVPSEISYSISQESKEQWGFDIASSSRIMSWTKLEFGEQDRPDELRLIAKALEGMRNVNLEQLHATQDTVPSYPTGDAVDIAADYLRKVRETAQAELRRNIGPHLFSTIPVDLVLTVPAVCRTSVEHVVC